LRAFLDLQYQEIPTDQEELDRQGTAFAILPLL